MVLGMGQKITSLSRLIVKYSIKILQLTVILCEIFNQNSTAHCHPLWNIQLKFYSSLSSFELNSLFWNFTSRDWYKYACFGTSHLEIGTNTPVSELHISRLVQIRLFRVLHEHTLLKFPVNELLNSINCVRNTKQSLIVPILRRVQYHGPERSLYAFILRKGACFIWLSQQSKDYKHSRKTPSS